MCQLNEEGGMGFRDMGKFNIAIWQNKDGELFQDPIH